MSLNAGERRIGVSLSRTVSVRDFEPVKVTVWDEQVIPDDEDVGKAKTRLGRALLKHLNCRIREAVEDQFGKDALIDLEQ